MYTNLLEGQVSQNFIDFVLQSISAAKQPDWLVNLISGLFGAVGIVAVGVIVFTLILKTIVLPLDLYQRITSKRQALIMEKMRPQMEKLQKTYANDKQMYSQKVMELQKKSGYSMFGACLPMIVSLVIFMVMFSALSNASQFANLTSYNNMVDAYNKSVIEYVYTDLDENGQEKVLNEDGFLLTNIDESTGKKAYRVDFGKFIAHPVAQEKDVDAEGEEKPTYLEEFNALGDYASENDKISIVRRAVRKNARKAAADFYHNVTKKSEGMLWIGNVWYPDSMLNKEMPQEFSKFASAVSRVASSVDSSYELSYNEVTADLSKEKSTFNGYFVLIVLSIGLSFLQQFITMRSQKSVGELGSVDGSGARTNKWMLIIMPIIFAIFSFFYSASFSIYMIVNTVYSIITMAIVNAILNVRFKKMEERGELDEYLNRKARKREEKMKKRAAKRKIKR